ncbi:hypothetical protein [Spirochaeta isovalerica]|uniref:Uncharacterized protein n=1 Tax=Spirochaeta isovalerica TaxID=150 RepID=A0A841RIA3_9SPIO|nr:hypothetical protein [Spirochaeta isovalerica]MBB6482479.1 hypothetical protein [Spirochaeta isovalerica]
MRLKILLGIIGWVLFLTVAVLEFIEMYNYKRIKVEILGLSLLAFALIFASIKIRPSE